MVRQLQVERMGKFHITKSIKKDFTESEEEERILSNLRRLHKISMYPHNSVKEGMVLGQLNVELCGIDKSGREKVFFDTSYNHARYPPISLLGVEECRRRNYCVVQKAIGELVPGGKNRFKLLMPIEEFYLYTFNNNVYWLDGGCDIQCILAQNHYLLIENWEKTYKVQFNQIWKTYNSVEICKKVLNVIKKQLILNKLAGVEETEYAFLGALG